MAKIPRLLPLIAIAIGGVVAVRAVGAGPGLFEGAKAWAEDATTAVTPASAPAPKAAPAVCALTPEQLAQQAGISPAELRIIQSLSARRTQLDARDADFATTLPLMVAAEQKLDAKLQALNAIKGEVQGLLGQVDAKDKAETDRLVAVYSAMRPREAAAIFATLEDSVRLPIASAMRPRGLSAILAQMPAPAARELTEKLARRYQAQQLAARAAVAGTVEAPAAQPVDATPPKPAQAATPAVASAATPARPTPRPVRRPGRTATRPTPKPAVATPAPAGPQPYAPSATASAASPAAPRQSVQ